MTIVTPSSSADELAEEELLEVTVSYCKDVTGVENTIFISPKGNTRHEPRIKLAIDPPDSIDPRSSTAGCMACASLGYGQWYEALGLDRLRSQSVAANRMG